MNGASERRVLCKQPWLKRHKRSMDSISRSLHKTMTRLPVLLFRKYQTERQKSLFHSHVDGHLAQRSLKVLAIFLTFACWEAGGKGAQHENPSHTCCSYSLFRENLLSFLQQSPPYPQFPCPWFRLAAVHQSPEADDPPSDISSGGQQQPNTKSQCLRRSPHFILKHYHLPSAQEVEGCAVRNFDRPHFPNFQYRILL